MIRLIELILSLAMGLAFCIAWGVMLRLACKIYNYGGSTKGAPKPQPEIDDLQTVEYLSAEAGPYTSPSTFARQPSATHPDDPNHLFDTTHENFVSIPGIDRGVLICFIMLIGSAAVAFFLIYLGHSNAFDDFYQSMLMTSLPWVVFGMAAVMHSVLVSIFLKTSWRKGMILTFFCGLQIVAIYLVFVVLLLVSALVFVIFRSVNVF